VGIRAANPGRWYLIPEFEVLHCCACGAIFIDQVVKRNSDFTVEYEIKTYPAVVVKSANDLHQVIKKLTATGLVSSVTLDGGLALLRAGGQGLP
jgi:hypothetical protein